MSIFETSGDGALYRTPPAIKLLALFGFSLLLFALDSVALLAGPAGLVLIGALLACPQAVRQWLRAWVLLLTIAVVAAWTVIAAGWEAATVVLLRLGALSLAATVVTATTTAGEFIETITRLARPLERLGIGNARDIGLAIGLVIRFIPEVQAQYRMVVEAHRARGLALRPATIIVPLLIGAMLSADEIADAIDARSIRGEKHRGD